ncbi:Os06g0178601 [Oryza sativa Japonica Group]|uniref:Os06g0176801 protein n=1 Tax=Oryza sativa subsp. japonica TaxID=39947 RepID=A0A0P0WT22_ORYSJ|nr:hypothetical protein EE612_032245 [Oryza sativa]BAS96424.1 Os06g0176801 [Oryza sativa Japonica Group]BAS96439.1 Os06g0178601 [Oryza sativa Japonica Group]
MYIYLHSIPHVDEQSIGDDGHIVPDALPQHLKPTDGVVDGDDGDHRAVGVWLQAQHILRPQAARVVVEPRVRRGVLVEHVDEVALSQAEQPGQSGEHKAGDLPAPHSVLMQNISV